jgi:hypothetical protein
MLFKKAIKSIKRAFAVVINSFVILVFFHLKESIESRYKKVEV